MVGGIVAASDLRLTYDPKPELVVDTATYDSNTEKTYRVRGLEELHPDPDLEEFEVHRVLGIGMLEYYKQYAARNDNFAVIAAEHDFSVPLGFEAIDPRDGKRKPVHYRGRMDIVIQDLESGRFGIFDHKTAARIDEDYFRKLDKDEQCTSYMWAGEREAEIYDLPYKQIDFVIYNALRKNVPRTPTITTKGVPSLDRQNESTTAEMFRQCISDNNLQVWLDGNEKAQGYLAWLDEIGEENFIVRRPVRRNRAEIESASWRIEAEARTMLAIEPGIIMYKKATAHTTGAAFPNPDLYPSPTGDRSCLNCNFRVPCIAFDDGSSWEVMIEDGYESNVDR